MISSSEACKVDIRRGGSARRKSTYECNRLPVGELRRSPCAGSDPGAGLDLSHMVPAARGLKQNRRQPIESEGLPAVPGTTFP